MSNKKIVELYEYEILALCNFHKEQEYNTSNKCDYATASEHNIREAQLRTSIDNINILDVLTNNKNPYLYLSVKYNIPWTYILYREIFKFANPSNLIGLTITEKQFDDLDVPTKNLIIKEIVNEWVSSGDIPKGMWLQ